MYIQRQRSDDNHSTAQMNYINILDKCSQIMREDRIWLRTQIKNNSQQAVALFKGLSKMPNMKQLQIKLRKYINNTKQKEKQQQLIRFKQNMNSTHNIGLKQHFNCKQNSRQSNQKNKTMQTNRHQTSVYSKSPLQQTNQNRQPKSLLSKWNNYTHYSSKNIQGDNGLKNRPSQSNSKTQSKKQWVNIYKPHTFNKMLNGELNNKLNSKNSQVTHLKRNTKSVQLKNFIHLHQNYQTQKEQKKEKTFTNTLNPINSGLNRQNNSSLKKFDFNSTKQMTSQRSKLTTVQPGKYKIAKQPQTKSFTKPFFQQNYNSKHQQNYSTSKLTKQNIDQILKYKLGYPYQFDGLNEENNTEIQQKYNYGQFPPIQQQTERDSQYITSQRNQKNDQNKMFSIVNSNDYSHNKGWQIEGAIKQGSNSKGNNMNSTSYFNNLQNTFKNQKFSNMLSKDQKQPSNNSQEEQTQSYYQEENSYHQFQKTNKKKQILQCLNQKNRLRFYKDEQKINRLFNDQNQESSSSDRISSRNIQITEPVANRLSNISNSYMEQSFKKVPILESKIKYQTDFNNQSQLHKSIMNSIRKSQQDFPSYGLQSANQEKLSIPKSSPYSQFQDRNTSNKEYDKYANSNSQQKCHEFNNSSNKISSFLSSQVINIDLPNYSVATKANKQALIQKSSLKEDDIFTSPDLLNQCRMFLKKSKQLPQITFDYSIKPILHDQSTPERFINAKSHTNINQVFANLKSYVPEKRLMIDDHAITVTESITKDYYFSSQKNSQQKQAKREQSDSKMNIEGKKVNFQMIGSVKPIENQFKQFSQNKLKTEQNDQNQNSMKKNTSNKNYQTINKSIQDKKYLNSNSKQKEYSILSNNHVSNDKNIINESQQSIKSKKVKEGDVVSYDGIHTFSNQSMSKSKQNSNRKTNRSAFNQVQLFDNRQSAKKKQTVAIKPITALICLEDIVDQFLQASEGSLQVSTQWLLHTIQNHYYFQQQVSKSLQSALSIFLKKTDQQIQLMSVLEYLFSIYQSQREFQYRDGNAKDIYNLLDIQRKGKITIQDIHSFCQSLQQAEIQNFQLISHKLQEMFEVANLSRQNTLTYLNLYIIKNQQIFEQVCHLLEDFQFQIQAE